MFGLKTPHFYLPEAEKINPKKGQAATPCHLEGEEEEEEHYKRASNVERESGGKERERTETEERKRRDESSETKKESEETESNHTCAYEDAQKPWTLLSFGDATELTPSKTE
ncbi:hypothetical protein INR49_021577 [Caranx melampygus]|nr:hypothetical protein INR49_021577 [Caranx melampygus]